MGNVKILAATKEQAEIVAPFMGAEAAEALESGLPITVLAAVDSDGVAGVLSGMVDRGAFDIDSIYVLPSKRRMGIGTALIDKLEDLFPEEETEVKAEFNIENVDNETLEPFLMANGFDDEEEDEYPKYYIDDLAGLKTDENLNTDDPQIISFSGIDDELLKAAGAESLNNGRPLPEGGLLSYNLDRNASYGYIKDNELKGYVTVEVMEDGGIKIPALWSEAADPRETLKLLNRTAEALKRDFAPRTTVAMLAIGPLSEKVILHLFPDADMVSRNYTKTI